MNKYKNTVADLIEALQDMPQDLEVRGWQWGNPPQFGHLVEIVSHRDGGGVWADEPHAYLRFGDITELEENRKARLASDPTPEPS